VRTEPDVQRIRELVERCSEWPVIVRNAERWRVVPSVYLQLRRGAQSGRVPGPVAEGLKHLYYRDTIHGVAKRELLRAALLRFAEASVPVIVLKGAALATLVYQSHTLRPTRRIELLVHHRDLARVEAVLRSLREAPGALGGPQGHALLDVRHDIFGQSSLEEMPAAGGIPIEDFWARARPVQIASVPTLVFGHEDLLLHLAMHLTANTFVGCVRTLCDIGETCSRYGDAIEWSQLIGRACAYDLAKPLYYSLRLAQELVGASVPSQALMVLRASFDQLPLEDRFIAAAARRALLRDAQSTSRLATVTALDVRLLLTRRARDSVTFVRRHLARACEGRLRRLAARFDPSLSRGRGSGSTNASRTRQTTTHPTFYGDRPVDTEGHVAVTYDQNASDGLGSQLQRIYGLYALARALDIKYVHTPLGRVNYQGLMPLLAGRTDPDFAARCNSFFALPSDDFDLDGCERVLVPFPNEKRIEQYRRYAAAIGCPVLLRAHQPYGYTDPHPEAYLAVRAVSPYRDFRREGPIRICIHVRRGDRVLSRDPRLLSNAYYLRACEAVVNALQKQRVSFLVRVHTEAPSRSCTVYPGFSGMFVDIKEPSTLDSAAHSLEEFKALPNLTMVLNVEPREALDDFATADVLILSCSCLGYVGGLLNPHGLVIAAPDLPPPRDFHAALPDWLVADEQGNVDATQLAARVAGLLRNR
jgi:putative nucleotidyltransferase-like protein